MWVESEIFWYSSTKTQNSRTKTLRTSIIKVIGELTPITLKHHMYIINYLKQARRNAKLSLQDMAYLLDMDFSNLSKYETGKKLPPTRVIIGYHIITKIPLKKLFKYNLLSMFDAISHKATQLISILEEETTTPKLKKRIDNLYEVLNTIGCLQDNSETDYDNT